MENFLVKDVVKATGGRLLCGSGDVPIRNCATNSSKSEPGLMFVPIIGERVDGHKYMESAFEYGAWASLTSEPEAARELIGKWKERGEAPKPLILVENTQEALQKLAGAYERRLLLPKVGVTGSVGKTTTKEMIACALSGGLRVFKTAGNANSQIGVPVTLMSIEKEYEAAVIEMGMSEQGEMERLARLLTLDAVVMTNIGVSHIEQLKTQENILAEKWHITDALRPGGTVFLNGDDVLLRKRAEREREKGNKRIVTYGRSEDCDYRAENIRVKAGGICFEAVYGEKCVPVSLKVLGDHNVTNALVAIAVAREFGVRDEAAVKALGQYAGVAMRQQITVRDGVTFIDDSYNASPDSMKAGLSVLAQIQGKRHIAVLADMLELGENAAEYHRQVGTYVGESKVDELLLFGTLAEHIGYGAEQHTKKIKHFDSREELIRYLEENKRADDVVLFKGSRGMKLNEAADYFTKGGEENEA